MRSRKYVRRCYKNFLRIHIDTEGVARVYPVGVTKVVTDWKNISMDKDKPKFKGSDPKYHLIEEPIELK